MGAPRLYFRENIVGCIPTIIIIIGKTKYLLMATATKQNLKKKNLDYVKNCFTADIFAL